MPNMGNDRTKSQHFCTQAFHQTLKINNPLLMIISSCFFLTSDVASKTKVNCVSKAAQLVFFLRKVEALSKERQDKHSRNNLSRDPIVPRVNEEYVTQFSEGIG